MAASVFFCVMLLFCSCGAHEVHTAGRACSVLKHAEVQCSHMLGLQCKPTRTHTHTPKYTHTHTLSRQAPKAVCGKCMRALVQRCACCVLAQASQWHCTSQPTSWS